MVYICPGGNCTGIAIFFFDKVSHLKHPNVHCTCSAGAWAGGFFGRGSLPSPATSRATYRAPSSNSFKYRTFEQNLDPLETILWQFWRLSWVLCIFLQHNFQYVPLDPPELISTLFICEKMVKLLGDNFGNLQKKRRFILRGIPWIGTFSGLLSLWGQM